MTYQPLPTITSRVFVITAPDDQLIKTVSEAFSTFLKSSYKDRLALATKGGGETKDPEWVAEMKSGLCHYILASRNSLPSAEVVLLGDILSRLDSKGASNKMLLEELALTLKAA